MRKIILTGKNNFKKSATADSYAKLPEQGKRTMKHFPQVFSN